MLLPVTNVIFKSQQLLYSTSENTKRFVVSSFLSDGKFLDTAINYGMLKIKNNYL